MVRTGNGGNERPSVDSQDMKRQYKRRNPGSQPLDTEKPFPGIVCLFHLVSRYLMAFSIPFHPFLTVPEFHLPCRLFYVLVFQVKLMLER